MSSPTLGPGNRLGRYELLEHLASGGMGEVYRGRDTELRREVAIKVLPSFLSADPERLRRFRQEALAAGMLNHPNILVVYDVDLHGGSPYLVTEIVDGQTLRAKLEKERLPLQRVVEIAVQVCDGLAAAHEKGIVHRDLKPENLMLTREDRVKILDFGIAKLVPRRPDEQETRLYEDGPATASGAVLGTLGYMSPEQLKGEPVDQRTDIFAFGTVLYELLTGKTAFNGKSATEINASILRDDPLAFPEAGSIPPGLRTVVQHCLDKSPTRRFQSISDVAFSMKHLSAGAAAEVSGEKPGVVFWIGLVALLLIATAVAYFAGSIVNERSIPSYKRLTFNRGAVNCARFSRDGRTVYYSASWNGGEPSVYSLDTTGTSNSLFSEKVDLLAVSVSGEMALLKHTDDSDVLALARAGEAPTEKIRDVADASWGPDGTWLLVLQHRSGKSELELTDRDAQVIKPAFYSTARDVASPRVSPDGKLVAFFEEPTTDDSGVVIVADLKGNKRVESRNWHSLSGLAWSPSGNEVWFAGATSGRLRSIHALSLRGSLHLIDRVPGALTLQDISLDGKVLVTSDAERTGILGIFADGKPERDFSWHDYSTPTDISDDGKTLLFDDVGEEPTNTNVVYFRNTDGSAPTRLGDGIAGEISPNKQWALALKNSSSELWMLPLGPGNPRKVNKGQISTYEGASWFPDGKSIVLAGSQEGRGTRLYVQEVPDGTPRPLTLEGITLPGGAHVVDPGGTSVIAVDDKDNLRRCVIPGGSCKVIPHLTRNDFLIRWSRDGSSVLVFTPKQRAPLSSAIDIRSVLVASGTAQTVRQIRPPDALASVDEVLVASDGKTVIYGYSYTLSDLYVADGLQGRSR